MNTHIEVVSLLSYFLDSTAVVVILGILLVVGLLAFAWVFIVNRKNNRQDMVSGDEVLGAEAVLSPSLCTQINVLKKGRRYDDH